MVSRHAPSLGRGQVTNNNNNKVLTTSPFQIQSSWQLSLLSCPPAASFFVTLKLHRRTPLTCIPPLYNLALPLLMLHSRPTLVFKPLILLLLILYLLFLLPHHCPLLLATLLSPPASSSPLIPSGFFNGMMEVLEPWALNCFTFFVPSR